MKTRFKSTLLPTNHEGPRKHEGPRLYNCVPLYEWFYYLNWWIQQKLKHHCRQKLKGLLHQSNAPIISNLWRSRNVLLSEKPELLPLLVASRAMYKLTLRHLSHVGLSPKPITAKLWDVDCSFHLTQLPPLQSQY